MTDHPVLLARARAEQDPFPHHHLSETFTSHHAERLRETFPTTGFRRVIGHDPDKTYTMWTRPLHPAPDRPADQLPAPWGTFVREVTGPVYRREMAGVTGLDLDACRIEVNLWRYPPDCWLDPHVDKETKLVTQVFYFNEPWPVVWGGNLLLLGSQDPDDVVRRIPPLHNSSVVLVRGEGSWHAVESALPENPGAMRLSAQVIFHRADQDLA
ncbi:2OG-Fe(II) oxygenase family protein [Streptomyces sp. NPDC101455]|uniref:2OG-Fe(II) oxygenase family protein n=1 Tax=Streptomyces sp. NPDC101455 TaxID=3366142 RepID=UPI003827FCA5